MSNENDIQFWRLPRVREQVGLSKTEIYRQVGQGRFPKPKKYPGSAMTFWLAGDVLRWQSDLLTSLNGATGKPAT